MSDLTLFDRAGEVLAVVRAEVGDDPGTWEIRPGSRESARLLHELVQESEPVWLEIEDIRIRGTLVMEPDAGTPRWFVRYRSYRPQIPKPRVSAAAAG